MASSPPPTSSSSTPRPRPPTAAAAAARSVAPAAAPADGGVGLLQPYPFKAIPTAACVVYHHTAADALVFTIQSACATAHLAARDSHAKRAWVGALVDVMPISLVDDAGTPGPLRRRQKPPPPLLLPAAKATGRTLQKELAVAEASLAAASADADARVAQAIAQLQRPHHPAAAAEDGSSRGGGALMRTPRKHAPLLGGAAAAVSTPASAPSAQLWQLCEVNRSLAAEVAECERDVDLLQRATVLLSTSEWARGEWIWCVRVSPLGGARTLWEVWHRAHLLHCAEAAERAAEEAHARWREEEEARLRRREAAAARGGAPPVWSALSCEGVVALDASNTSSKATRKHAAAAEQEEDWFISMANKLFEL